MTSDNATDNATVDQAAESPEEVTPQPASDSPSDASPQDDSDSQVPVGSPEYPSFGTAAGTAGKAGDLARLQNIQIAVSAELGRTKIPIQDLMQLSEGSVVELDRAIDSPVKLIAQGVTLATGEVVVVDGCFAIRILNVHENK